MYLLVNLGTLLGKINIKFIIQNRSMQDQFSTQIKLTATQQKPLSILSNQLFITYFYRNQFYFFSSINILHGQGRLAQRETDRFINFRIYAEGSKHALHQVLFKYELISHQCLNPRLRNFGVSRNLDYNSEKAVGDPPTSE